jgi:predicted RNase H-like HicB family nuclease
LFVELIVIGTAPLLILALLAAALLGPEALFPGFALTPVQGLLLLPFAYVLGIVTDRAADAWFQRRRSRIRSEFFASDKEIHEARRRILQDQGKVAEFMEYTRSRLRICRGWAFCGPTLLLAILVYGVSRGPVTPRGLALLGLAVAIAVALTVACRWAWAGLLRADYSKLREDRDAREGDRFAAIVEQDADHFIARCPEFPGANGQGKTMEAARESLAQAIALVLQDRWEALRR